MASEWVGDGVVQEWVPDSPLVVVDNGSGVIKAGFAGEPHPRVFLPNCAAQHFGKRSGASAAVVPHVTGDDICLIPEYFCLRPQQHGFLVDGSLQVAIWDRLFTKQLLDIPDPSEHSIIITEHFNTTSSVRHLLTQIIFEDLGFKRMVISPGQQLIPFAFPPLNTATSAPLEGSSSKLKVSKKIARLGKPGKPSLSSVQAIVIGDDIQTFKGVKNPCDSYSQLVVDVGHQATWIVPLYGELPLEFAAQRIDVGGATSSALLKNLIGYRQINLDRSELLVNHIKEESCFASLNYLEDLKQMKMEMKGKKFPPWTYASHHYTLPDFNTKDRTSLKNFFKSYRPATLPEYLGVQEDGLKFHLQTGSLAPDPREILQSAMLDAAMSGGNQQQQTPDSIVLNVERIAPAEVFFNPQDYEFSAPPSPSHETALSLQPPIPSRQAGLAEGIVKAIFASPAILQPMMAAKILLSGGSTNMPNFGKRLYAELRTMLPQDWPLRIYQLDCPSETPWIGASSWASENGQANYDAFCVTRKQYLEVGGAR